jgi:hypothetical protein
MTLSGLLSAAHDDHATRLFTVLFRNKLRIPLEGTYNGQSGRFMLRTLHSYIIHVRILRACLLAFTSVYACACAFAPPHLHPGRGHSVPTVTDLILVRAQRFTDRATSI